MIVIKCDGCHRTLAPPETNTITVKNVYNKKKTLHFCAECALERFPLLRTMLSWTAER